MAIASVLSNQRGHTDAFLNHVYLQLRRDGVRMVGALRVAPAIAGTWDCESDLWLLPDGPMARITQNLGPGSTACRMDTGAFEYAVGLATTRLKAGGADLVILNKFGLSEAEGRGFRALIADALGIGLPVLIGLSPTHRIAFERFSGGLATSLPSHEDAILAWCRQEASPRASWQ